MTIINLAERKSKFVKQPGRGTTPGRICILSTVHHAFDTRIFHKEAHTLVAAGYDVIYLVSHTHGEVIDGIQIQALPRRRLLARLLSLPGVFLRALKIHADVYHLHDPELIIVAAWLKLTGHRVIYDAHEDIGREIPHKDYLPRPLAAIMGVLANWLEKKMARRLDALITATPSIAEGFEGCEVHVVHNYPIIDPATPHSTPAFSQQGLHAIYVGDLEKVRGIRQIVEAAVSLPPEKNVRLTIVGRFSNADFEAEIRSIADGRISFAGLRPYPEAMRMLEHADVGLVCFLPLPNHLRALPNKIFEYMRAGLPLIVSNFKMWLSLVVETGVGLSVDPCDPATIGDALVAMLERSPEDRRRMGQRGQQIVYERNNWSTQAEILLGVYKEVLRKAKA